MNYTRQKIKTLIKSQKNLMNKMNNEKCDDIHSVLRSKQYAESIIELEVKIKTLIDVTIKLDL